MENGLPDIDRWFVDVCFNRTYMLAAFVSFGILLLFTMPLCLVLVAAPPLLDYVMWKEKRDKALNSEVKTHHGKGSEENHSEAVKGKSSGG